MHTPGTAANSPDTHVPVERALIAEAFDFIVEHGEGAPTDLERRLRAALADVPGRSEAEIKAEALREAADAMRRAKDPGHWNLRDPFDPDRAYSPDVWLERCAALLAKEGDQ